MNPKIWMTDSRGGPHLLDAGLVKEKENEGWTMLNQSELTSDFKPKLGYYAQYDSDRPSKKVKTHVSENEVESDELHTEIY